MTTTPLPVAEDPFWPSGHTGLLIHAIKSSANISGGSGLDMGVGSGILLALLGKLGVQRLTGIDIDPAALDAATRLLRTLDLMDRVRLLQGSLWEPACAERFDVVVANLPHFPTRAPAADPDHSVYWSTAGDDGRQFLDSFLAGLQSHLTPHGVAFTTHHTCLGLERTHSVLAAHGLTGRIIREASIPMHPDKAALMSSEVRARYLGRGITTIGPYEFLDSQVIEIRPLP